MQRGTIHPATRTMDWKVNKQMNNVTKNLNHQVRLAGFAWGAEMLATGKGMSRTRWSWVVCPGIQSLPSWRGQEFLTGDREWIPVPLKEASINKERGNYIVTEGRNRAWYVDGKDLEEERERRKTKKVKCPRPTEEEKQKQESGRGWPRESMKRSTFMR